MNEEDESQEMTVRESEELKVLLEEANTYVGQNIDFKIVNQEQFDNAQDKMKKVKAYLTRIENTKDEFTNEIRKSIVNAKASLEKQNKIFDPIIEKLEKLLDTFIAGSKSYLVHREKYEKEAQERNIIRMREEAEKRKRQLEENKKGLELRKKELEKGIEETEKIGDFDKIKELKIEKDIIEEDIEEIKMEKEILETMRPPQIDAIVKQKYRGINYRDRYKWKLIDINSLPKDLKICGPDSRKISALIKEKGEDAHIPGIEVFKDKIVTIRTE